MEKEKIRKEAIHHHLSGKSIAAICREFGVSRKWFYKWRARYQTGEENWYKDESRAPKTIPNKIEPSMEQLILSVRDKLENTQYAQIGASAIAWSIKNLGKEPPPSWTINRVLKRNGRIQEKSSKEKREKETSYPYFTEAYYPGHIHQSDLVGPRYIKGDGRFYAFNTIDIFSHNIYSTPIRSKDDDSIVLALIDTWKNLEVPEYLIIDNELSFRGSNRYPHSLGKVIKLCLSMHVQPVFIPPGEPWRNGTVERFNCTFDKRFYRTERFMNYEHLQTSLKQFVNFHNKNHIYTVNRGKTPSQIIENEKIKSNKLNQDYRLPDVFDIPYEGYIHLLRLIRSDLKLNIWGETFSMPKEVMYEYVRATIFTELHLLKVFLVDKLITQFEYRLPTLNQENLQVLSKEMDLYLTKLKTHVRGSKR